MGFSVLADKPLRSHQHSCVEESHTIAFSQTGYEVNLVLTGKTHPVLYAWTVRYPLRMVEGILPSTEEITCVGKLGQHNEIRPTVYRLERQRQAVTPIVFAILCAHLRVKLHDCYTNRACWLIHSR
ncbi:hypothetical protein D3C84_395840 [compost metagenome]